MNGWQVQGMWEADAAEEWERINEPDALSDVLRDAVSELKNAITHLETASGWLDTVLETVEETPVEAETEAYRDEIDNIIAGLKAFKEKWERGEW